MDRHRALPRGGRGLLVHRPGGDRPRARLLRAGGGRARGRTPTRSPSTASRRSTAAPRSFSSGFVPGLGAHDRAPLAVRDGGRDPDRRAAGLRLGRGRPGSPRRSSARRSTTACTRTCGLSGSGVKESRTRFEAAVEELWPYALGVLEEDQRGALCAAIGRDPVDPVERGNGSAEFRELWEEMTSVRRSVPGAAW